MRSNFLSLVPTPRNKTVVIDQGVFSVYDSFNPLIPNGEQYQAGVTQLAKEFLFYLNMATGKLEAWQGASWSYNPSFTQCTLKIKSNITWSDGKPFTSADIAFTTELMKKNTSLIGGGLPNATWTPQVVSVETPNPTTAVFNLSARNTRFHYNFICQIITAPLLVLPQHVWSGQDITTFKNDPPIYTGPYTLQKTIQDLGLFIWEKNPNYWAKAVMNPAPPYVVFRNAPTDADLENEEYKEGLIDALNSSTSYEYATLLQDGGDNDVLITNFLDSDQRCIYVNCDPSRGAFASPKFRYAVSLLINRQKVLKDVWPVPTTVDTYPWPNYPNTFAWDNKAIAKEFAQYREYNPKKAGQLLDELGIKKGSGGNREYNGKPVTMNIITPVLPGGYEYIVGQLLVEEFQNLGINSSLKYPTSAVFSSLNTRATGTSYRCGWAAPSSTRGRGTSSSIASTTNRSARTPSSTTGCGSRSRLSTPRSTSSTLRARPQPALMPPSTRHYAVLHLPAGYSLPPDGLLARHQHQVLDRLAN